MCAGCPGGVARPDGEDRGDAEAEELDTEADLGEPSSEDDSEDVDAEAEEDEGLEGESGGSKKSDTLASRPGPEVDSPAPGELQ